MDKVEKYLNKGVAVSEWLGICVYEPHRIRGETVWRQIRSPPEKLTNIMTIGVHEEHAFLIKDVEKLAKIYECKDCHQRFKRSCHMQRHSQTCNKGQTRIFFPKVNVTETKIKKENVFYPKHSASKESLLWLEREAKERKIHIHHTMCGHGGECWVEGAPVDGYDPAKKMVYQYHGCHWHGCRSCYPDNREEIVGDKTREDRYKDTIERTARLRKTGYMVIEVWECEVGWITGVELPKVETKSYPDFIIYDFESYGDHNMRKEVTPMLKIENEHVPISVSTGNHQQREPTHICERDQAEPVRKFVEELERLFQEKGMQNFADWLRYYNNLDVVPGMEALEKMRSLYTEKGIDMLKGAVSLPGVS